MCFLFFPDAKSVGDYGTAGTPTSGPPGTPYHPGTQQSSPIPIQEDSMIPR